MVEIKHLRDYVEYDRAMCELNRIAKDVENCWEWHECIPERDGEELEAIISKLNRLSSTLGDYRTMAREGYPENIEED